MSEEEALLQFAAECAQEAVDRAEAILSTYDKIDIVDIDAHLRVAVTFAKALEFPRDELRRLFELSWDAIDVSLKPMCGDRAVTDDPDTCPVCGGSLTSDEPEVWCACAEDEEAGENG